MANDAAQSAIDPAGGFLPPVVYVTAIMRTTVGINKSEDAGTAHGQISSSGALQRVFPTTASSYLQFRCWIRQDTLCNRMSVTFLNEAMRSVTRFYNISHRTIRNPSPTGNPRRLGVDRRSLSENCCDAIGSLADRARYVLKGEPDNVIAACLLTSTNTIDRDSPGNYSPDGCTIAHASR